MSERANDALAALRERVANLETRATTLETQGAALGQRVAALETREARLETLVRDLAVATEAVVAHRSVADTNRGERLVPGEPPPPFGPARDPEYVATMSAWSDLRRALAAIRTTLGD